MIKTIQTIDGIDEHKLGYNAKIEGYTNSSSDIPCYLKFQTF